MARNATSFEAQAISQMEFKEGILDVESNNPHVQALANIQKAWRKTAAEDQKQVANEVYSREELEKDEKWVSAEETKRYKTKQFEYKEKVMAAVEFMYLFEKSGAEAEKGIQVIPLSRFDQLTQNADMILSIAQAGKKNIGLALSIQNALNDGTAVKKAASFIDAIRAGKIEVTGALQEKGEKDIDAKFKYIADEDLRGQEIPRIEIYINNGGIEKIADAIMASTNTKDLTEKEKDLKTKIRLEIERQLFALQGALHDFIDKADRGVEPAKLAKAQELLPKVNNFYENFKQ